MREFIANRDGKKYIKFESYDEARAYMKKVPFEERPKHSLFFIGYTFFVGLPDDVKKAA